MRLGPAGLALLCLSVALVAAVSLTALLTGESDHAAEMWLTFFVGLSFAVCGLVAWYRRPSNRTGALMVLLGLTWFAGTLAAVGDSGISTVGLVVAALPFGLFTHLVLAFPSGRLRGRAEKAVVAAAYLDVTVMQVAALLFLDPTERGCERCAENGLHVFASGTGFGVALALQRTLGVAIVAAGITLLVRRWRSASPAYRRVLAPVFWTSGLTGVLLAVSLTVAIVSEQVADVLWYGVLAALMSVPLAFLAGLVRARLAQAAVGQLVVELGTTPAPGKLRDALARALRDPALYLAFWLPESGSYVDADGTPLELPPDGSGQAATLVEVDGRHVGALIHDASLRDHQELVDAVSAAAGLALEKERLQAELRARVAELAAERDFVSAVVDTAEALVLVLDREGRFVRFNRACERASGYTFAEVQGLRLNDLLPPEERAAVETALDEVRAGAQPSENENHWVTKSGERRLIAWMNTALTGPTGEAEYIVSSGLDVTEKRRAEAALRASRARIVDAGDRERRRLERNLHDGAQQHLVSLLLTLRMASASVRTRPEEAERILEGATEELAMALKELQELARGIHPAVLTERGLAGAVEGLAGRTPLPVDLDVAAELEQHRLSAPVEVAAYYVVAESIANVTKYAHATAVRVSLARQNGSLLVEVADDGLGGAVPGEGSGLTGLADRVQALDGRLVVESPQGVGTTVRAEIPLR